MASLEKFKEAARKYEQKEQWAKAIEQLAKAIEAFEQSPEDDAELGLYNRIGDLYQKVGDGQSAVSYYERAVDRYTEGGLTNNAIALCNKILRITPGRAQVYLKLGILFHKKGFGAEAKQNILEYADRMQKAGQLEEAFKALRTFAQMSGSDEIWAVLAQQARAQAKTPEAAEAVEKLLAEFEAKDRVAQQRKSRMSRSMITGEVIQEEKGPKKGELVFLDVGEVGPPRRSSGARAPAAQAPPLAPAAPPRPSRVSTPKAPVAEEPAPPPEIPLLEIEPTSLAPEEPPTAAPARPSGPPMLEIEPTSLAEPEPALAEPPGLELEPTSLAEPEAAAEPVLEAEPEPAPEPVLEAEPVLEMEPELEIAPEPTSVAEPEPAAAAPAEFESLELEVAPAAPAEEAAAARQSLPMLDLGGGAPPPDVLTPATETLFSLDGEQAAAPAEAETAGLEGGAVLAFLELGEVTPTAPAAEDLEARLSADPQDWEAHRLYGEALLEKGEREQGLGELDAALDGYDQADDLASAYSVVEEVLRLDPNSVRHHQKRVELAYRQGDKARLVDAYVELGDALLRSDDPGKAIAVYQRVLEHDPGNVRAKSALDALAPPAPPPEAAPAARRPSAAPAPAPASAPAAATGGEYVDLGALLLEEETPKDTRMRIQDEEPTGDEQKDFQQMLAAFKRGIEANVGEEDFQSHYDLGVAYKEMGLLDEAIAEFQKALRATEGRLRSSEALGLCFFEKGQFAVAEAILRRALELPATGDAERVGLLYWLGRALEEQSKNADALVSYNRVFAVDIRFQDVKARVNALSKAGA
jgi:tetratricopeptide (TPR) repeat protein